MQETGYAVFQGILMTLMASLSQSNYSVLIISEPISALAYVMVYFMFLTLIADVICSLLPLDIFPFLPHFPLFVPSRLHSCSFSLTFLVCARHTDWSGWKMACIIHISRLNIVSASVNWTSIHFLSLQLSSRKAHSLVCSHFFHYVEETNHVIKKAFYQFFLNKELPCVWQWLIWRCLKCIMHGKKMTSPRKGAELLS